MSRDRREAGARSLTVRRYVVVAEGQLDPAWSDRLSGFTITADPEDPGRRTRLEGDAKDQSQLLGVLTALVDLHLTVVSVEQARVDESRQERNVGS